MAFDDGSSMCSDYTRGNRIRIGTEIFCRGNCYYWTERIKEKENDKGKDRASIVEECPY